MTKKQIEGFDKYCGEKDFKAVQIWTSFIIEGVLYADYQDLLFAYLRINLTDERSKIKEV